MMSDALRDAGSSPVFLIGVAIILILAVIGYLVIRRAMAASSPSNEEGKVIHDWMPTGRIDFAGPSLDPSAADTPALFYLQAEDVRFVASFSGIERKEMRWRKATLNEAKRVVHMFHQHTIRKTDQLEVQSAVSGASMSGKEKVNGPTANVDP
jgi:hypothetical protein